MNKLEKILKQIRNPVISIACILLAGCGAVPRSTGVMQVGPDTFRVSARGSVGNVMESQKMAFSESSNHCKSLGRELIVIATNQIEAIGGGPYEVTFRCLNKSDPELVRPTLERAPDTVIKIK